MRASQNSKSRRNLICLFICGSDTNKSGQSNHQSSDRSFSILNQLNREQDSRSNSREYKRILHPRQERLHPPRAQQNGIPPKNESSSLRMFLEELKNDDSNLSNRQNYSIPQSSNKNNANAQNNRAKHLQLSPEMMSSMGSSANMEILKVQEESFSKIHQDIASLQNKIKGLETKLGSKNTQGSTKNINNTNSSYRQEIFKERNDIHNHQFQKQQQQQHQNTDEDESRIKRYHNNQHQNQKQHHNSNQSSSNQKYISSNCRNQERQTTNESLYSIKKHLNVDKENQSNQQLLLKNMHQEQDSHQPQIQPQIFQNQQQDDHSQTSDSDTLSYQTFPLRLKRQYQQQHQDIENQRVQLNERFSKQRQIHKQPSQRIDNASNPNDSAERPNRALKIKQPHQNYQTELPHQIISQQPNLETEHDQLSNYSPQVNSSQNEEPIHLEEQEHNPLNDSTISVSEQMKQRIKLKMNNYKKNKEHKQRPSSRNHANNKSLSASLRRSNTQEFSKRDNQYRVKRQVRFSENKHTSRSQDRRSSQQSQDSLPSDLLEQRKQNAQLKQEMEKLRRKYEIREDYYNKWRDLKIQFKELHDEFKVKEVKRKEQKEVIEQQKTYIAKLKKKLKSQKEKLKKLKSDSPDKTAAEAQHHRVSTKSVSKTYRQFKNDENTKQDSKVKSTKKVVQPSDINNQLKKSNEGEGISSFRKYWTKVVEFFKSKGFLRFASAIAVGLLFYKAKGLYDNSIPISDALEMIHQNKFSKVVVGSLFLICYFKSPTTAAQYCISNRQLIGERKLSEVLQVSSTKYSSPAMNESQIGYLLLIGLYSIFVYKLVMNLKDMHGFKGKQKKDIGQQQKDRSFEDVGGCIQAKNAIKEIIDCIQKPELYKSAGVRMPKGVLLYGPPGTGKTLIAKAAATEAGIPVIYCSGSEFVEVFVGLGAKRIRDIFTQARAAAPCMIFIDEIDAVGFSRGNNNYIIGGGHREMETTLNELLNQMDGFEENDRILVVAATNLAQTLDPALQRPGRFDQKIEIKLPTQEERTEIFKIHLRNKQHSLSENDLNLASQIADGCSGAEIENIVNLVALQSVRKAQSMKLNHVNLESKDFISFVDGFIKDKRKLQGLNNVQNPHHYYRQ